MNTPKYYRNEFTTWLPCFYDFLIKIAFLGKEEKARRIILEYVPKNSERILDLATGTGSVAIEIKKRFSKAKVIGIDLSEKMLDKARKKAEKSNLNISFLNQNIEKTYFRANYFDVVVISLGLHELPKKNRIYVLKETNRILKKGGTFIIQDLNKPKSWLGQKLMNIHLKFFEPDYAKTILDGHLINDLRRYNFQKIKRNIKIDGYIQLIRSKK